MNVSELIFFLFSREVPWLRVSKIRRLQKTALNKKSTWFEKVQRKSIPKHGRNGRICVPPNRESAKVPHRLRQDSISLNEMLLLCLILIATLVLMSGNDASGAPDTRLHLVEKKMPTRIADMLSLLSVISSACNTLAMPPAALMW
jgi:hypothetical protein